jgi:hypothetical protein
MMNIFFFKESFIPVTGTGIHTTERHAMHRISILFDFELICVNIRTKIRQPVT